MSDRPRGCMVVLLALFLLLMLPFLWRHMVVRRYGSQIHETSNAPSRPTAIVFGAGVGTGAALGAKDAKRPLLED